MNKKTLRLVTNANIALWFILGAFLLFVVVLCQAPIPSMLVWGLAGLYLLSTMTMTMGVLYEAKTTREKKDRAAS